MSRAALSSRRGSAIVQVVSTCVTALVVGDLLAMLHVAGLSRLLGPARFALVAVAAFAAIIGLLSKRAITGELVGWCGAVGFALASVAYTADPIATTLRALSLAAVVFATCGAMPVLANGGQGRDRTAMLFRLVTVGVGAIFGAGFVGRFVGGNVWHTGGELFRGYFSHPNTLGALAAMWGPPIAALSADKRRPWAIAGWGMTIAVLASDWMSRCRGGLLSTLVGLLAMWTVGRRGVSPTGILAVVLLLAAGLGAATFDEQLGVAAWDSVVGFAEKGGETNLLASRAAIFEVSRANFENSPVIGHGYGASPGEAPSSEIRLSELGGREKGNSYLGLLEEVGVAGFAVFLIPILIHLGRARRVRQLGQRGDRHAALAAGAFGGVVGGLVAAGSEGWLFSGGAPLQISFFFVAASASALANPDAIVGAQRSVPGVGILARR